MVLLLHNESLENLSYENEFNLHENEPVDRTYFNLNCFAPRLVLSLRPKKNRKWPIGWDYFSCLVAPSRRDFFSYKEAQFKKFCLLVKTDCSLAENINESPGFNVI